MNESAHYSIFDFYLFTTPSMEKNLKLQSLEQAIKKARTEYIASHGVSNVLRSRRSEFRKILLASALGDDTVDDVRHGANKIRNSTALTHPKELITIVNEMLRKLGERDEDLDNPFQNKKWHELLKNEEMFTGVIEQFNHYTQMMIGNFKDVIESKQKNTDGNHQMDAHEWPTYRQFWAECLEGNPELTSNQKITIESLGERVKICENIASEIRATSAYCRRFPKES